MHNATRYTAKFMSVSKTKIFLLPLDEKGESIRIHTEGNYLKIYLLCTTHTEENLQFLTTAVFFLFADDPKDDRKPIKLHTESK